MKPLSLVGLFLIAVQFTAFGLDSAYNALRVFGKKEGEQALYKVVELYGRNGAPQPAVWKLVIDDPKARGGLREIEVQGGKIVSERTPVGRDLGAPMNFNQLNLDSEGVFTVVNQEAQKRGVSFDRLDYFLHSGNASGVPIWEISLFDGKAGKVGTMRVAADSGEILEQQFGPRGFADDRRFVEPNRGPGVEQDRRPPPEYRDDERNPGEDIKSFFNRVGRHFQKRGRQLNNFFNKEVDRARDDR